MRDQSTDQRLRCRDQFSRRHLRRHPPGNPRFHDPQHFRRHHGCGCSQALERRPLGSRGTNGLGLGADHSRRRGHCLPSGLALCGKLKSNSSDLVGHGGKHYPGLLILPRILGNKIPAKTVPPWTGHPEAGSHSRHISAISGARLPDGLRSISVQSPFNLRIWTEKGLSLAGVRLGLMQLNCSKFQNGRSSFSGQTRRWSNTEKGPRPEAQARPSPPLRASGVERCGQIVEPVRCFSIKHFGLIADL